MTIEKMKQLKEGNILIDIKCSKGRQNVLAFVVEVQDDGVIVRGFDSHSKPFYYDEITHKNEELIKWAEHYFIDIVDEARMNEPGYLL